MRNVPTGCGNPSNWSSGIARYYGVLPGSGSNFNATTSQNENIAINYNSQIPLNEYYDYENHNLYVETIDLYLWLDFIYGNRNVEQNEVDTVLDILANKKSFKFVEIEIYNNFGTKVYGKR